MTPWEREVRAAIYTSFLQTTRAPSATDLASKLSSSKDAVVSAWRSLANAHALVLQPGTDALWMAHPFSAIATDFVVTVGDHQWFANCVWDGLSIIAQLGDGHLETHCPGSQVAMRFEVQDGVVRGEGLVHFLVPARRFWDHIGFT